MSRRIVFAILAAASALICTPARADRECFENSCRMPEAVEPPPQTVPAPAVPAETEPGPSPKPAPWDNAGLAPSRDISDK